MYLQRIQTYQDPNIIKLLSLYAKEEGVSLAEVLRRAAAEYAQRPQVKLISKNNKQKAHPLQAIIGIGQGTIDASTNVDEIYDQDV